MKRLFTFTAFIFTFYLAGVSASTASPDTVSVQPEKPSLQEVLDDSSLWPFRVNIRRDVFLAANEKLPVSGAFPGVVVRVEGQKVVVDFGREGIHVLPVERTDFHARALKEVGDAFDEEKDLPNFIRYTTNMFMLRDEDGKVRNIPLDQMDKEKQFLIAYLDQRLFEEPERIEGFKEVQTALKKVDTRTLTFPTDPTFYFQLKETDLSLVACLLHLVDPMIESLYHQPGDDPLFVMIDAEGKILGTWRGDYSNFSGLAEQVGREAPGLVPSQATVNTED